MSIESLQKAVGIMGGQAATARALSTLERKLAQAHIWNWLNSKNPDQMPPAEYCPAIERATGARQEYAGARGGGETRHRGQARAALVKPVTQGINARLGHGDGAGFWPWRRIMASA